MPVDSIARWPAVKRTWQFVADASGIAEIEALKLQVQSLQAALEASVRSEVNIELN